jgi:exopolysaccharide biosynthesis protein
MFFTPKKIICFTCSLIVLVGCYLTVVYSDNSFIFKWRTIYIETAMSTMTHQWLATAFIPASVIDSVVEETNKQIEDNMVAASDISEIEENIVEEELTPKDYFAATYYEIDMDTMPEGLEYNNLQISNIENLGIKTVNGDSVWGIDTINGIEIITVKNSSYTGKLAIIKDSSKVMLGRTSLSNQGQTVTDICKNYGAVLGINASGFVDYNGKGNGKSPIGLEISEQTIYSSADGGKNQIVGFDNDNNLQVGYDLDINNLRDAVEFYPVIVLNGEKNTSGSFGLGLQPRAAIGQTKDKSTLFLIIDGRQVGYSLGATVSDCADILVNYGAYNALNLDGGSSASMTYMGKMITKTSSPNKNGRSVPNAWIVLGEQKIS